MNENIRLTLQEYELIKKTLLTEFDRQINKKINIDFFITSSNFNIESDPKEKKDEIKIDNIKEQCGLKLYAVIFSLYSGYNSYARYTSASMDYITSFLADNKELAEIFLNITHEIAILLSTNDLSERRLFETLQYGYSLFSLDPSNENNSLLNKNILSSIYIQDKVLFNFLKDNICYVVIILLLSYFDESSFYKTYNECYKGKK